MKILKKAKKSLAIAGRHLALSSKKYITRSIQRRNTDMKKALTTIAISALALTAAHAAILDAWDFSGENSVATSTSDVHDANLDSTGVLSRGAGAPASAANNSFRTVGFKNDGIAITNTDYFQFSLSAASGFTLSLSTIDATFAGTGTFSASPGVSMAFAYDIDGGGFTLLPTFAQIGNGAMPQIDLTSVSALQNLSDSDTVTFRMYASGQTSTGGWGYITNTAGTYGLNVGGLVSPVPEPASVALVGLGIGGLILLRRRIGRKA